MAGKFQIFCDESPRPTYEPQEKPISQQDIAPQPGTSTTATATTTVTASNNQQQDQQAFKTSEQQEGSNSNKLNNQTQNTNILQPLQQLKREPLGLRQASHTSQAVTAAASAILADSQQTNSSSSALSGLNEEDQENDISMASLGSDFMPSILHDGETELDDEDGIYIDDDYENVYLDDDVDVYEDDDDDEELQLELSQAFKQHEDSQLFKSTAYIDDIQKYLTDLERKPDSRPLPNYMDLQNDIDSDKRAILINWLVEVSDEYGLQSETLFICASIIDRFLSKMHIQTKNFQLLGVAAMFIASKYEEIYPPDLHRFVEVTDDTYSGHEIRQMEQEILKTLNFRISLPTITFFLRQIFAFNKFSRKVYYMAEYLCYLSLVADQPFLEYYPSEIALAAVMLSAHQLDAAENISSELKTAYDKSNLDQLERRNLPEGVKLRDLDRRLFTINAELPFCIEALRTLQERTFKLSSVESTNETSVTFAIHKKFSQEMHNSVSLIKPPKIDILYSIND